MDLKLLAEVRVSVLLVHDDEVDHPLVLSEEPSLIDVLLSVPVDGELGITLKGSIAVVCTESVCEQAVLVSLVDNCDYKGMSRSGSHKVSFSFSCFL